MKKLVLCYLLSLCFLGLQCQEADVPSDERSGLWLGSMKVSEALSLQLAFQIDAEPGGMYSAKMNVIEQKAFDIPMDIMLFLIDPSLFGKTPRAEVVLMMNAFSWTARSGISS